MLSGHNGSVSVIENLAPKLAGYYEIECASSKKLQIARLLDMLFTFLKRRRKTTVVIIDSYSTRAFWYTIAISLACRLFRIPYIPVLHGGNFPERLKKSKFWSKQVFENSFVNVAPSGYLFHHFKSAGFYTVYIPNHIDIDKYTFRLRDSARPKILWVRAFHKIYNPNLAIDVVSRLKADFPLIELCMTGADKDGSLAVFNEYAITKGVEKQITITGRLSQKEWAALSADYDIFLNTTNIDNAPVSVIEAMSLGMLIVSTNAGGLPFLLDNAKDSIMVPAGDADAMASAIKKLLDSPELCHTLSVNAREKTEGFSWEVVKELWFDVLDKFKISNT